MAGRTPSLCFAAVLTALSASGCGYGRRATCATFAGPRSGEEVEITTSQRVPDSWGGEENVYARFRGPAFETGALEIDINGRFCDRLRVDLSREGRWARISTKIDPPQVGEQTFTDDGKGGFFVFMPQGSGRNIRRTEYRWSVVAYVDFSTETVIRYAFATSTTEERRTLLPMFEELPPAQTIRGTDIVWTTTTRR